MAASGIITMNVAPLPGSLSHHTLPFIASPERDDANWLKRGKQRQAVVRVLRKPMTAKEICLTAKNVNQRIQLRDVWHLLKEMQARGLVECHNLHFVTGRLYCLTQRGKIGATRSFGVVTSAKPIDIDWGKYSRVIRAKVRRLTLLGLWELKLKTKQAQTATAIRRHVREKHPVGLNPIVRALKELLRLGLVREAGITRRRSCKLYQI